MLVFYYLLSGGYLQAVTPGRNTGLVVVLTGVYRHASIAGQSIKHMFNRL
jgi:hypothetical protein